MKARLAKKIQKQVSPHEVNDKNRSYWDRYNRAWLYSQRLDELEGLESILSAIDEILK